MACEQNRGPRKTEEGGENFWVAHVITSLGTSRKKKTRRHFVGAQKSIR